MKRLYWTHPNTYEAEVEVTASGECLVTVEPVVFHPDEGGQPPDKGTIGPATVVTVDKTKGQIVHTLDRSLADGRYTACVDQQHRQHTASHHTAQHIISGLAQARFDLKTMGVHIGMERSTVDFDRKVDWETLQALEQACLAVVTENLQVETVFDGTEVRSRFDVAAVGDAPIRVVKIGSVDASACCGAHVQRTGDIGSIRIIDVENIKKAMRMTFLAGPKALAFSQTETAVLRTLRQTYKCATQDLPVIARKALDQTRQSSKELTQIQTAMLPTLVASARTLTLGTTAVGIQVDAVSPKPVGKLAALMAKEFNGTGLVVGEHSLAIHSQDLDARELLKILLQEAGGKGGGSPTAVSGQLNRSLTADQIAGLLQTQYR